MNAWISSIFYSTNVGDFAAPLHHTMATQRPALTSQEQIESILMSTTGRRRQPLHPAICKSEAVLSLLSVPTVIYSSMCGGIHTSERCALD